MIRDLLEVAIRAAAGLALLYAAAQVFGWAWVGLVLALGAVEITRGCRWYL